MSAVAVVDVDPVVRRALEGDRDAERELCRRVLPAMRAFAQRRLQRAAAEDFAHDALIVFVEAIRGGRIDDPSRVGSFALGICRNLARERARNDDRRRELLEQFGPDSADLVVQHAEQPVRAGLLEDCYSQLTERARSIIRATFCDDHDDEEIAQRLALSKQNVRVIRHRTLAALRECLERPISWSEA